MVAGDGVEGFSISRTGSVESGVVERSRDSAQELMLETRVEGSVMPVHVAVKGPSDGEKVLVLHGWGASIEHMRGLIDDLSMDYRVAALDFPGHGKSPAPSVGYGMDGHLDVMDAVLEELDWTTFNVVGHSNGGRTAISWAALRSGSRSIAAMVLVAPSGILRRRTASFHIKTWAARILKAPFHILPGPIKRAGLDWLRHSLVWRLLGSSDYRSLQGPMRDTFVRTVNHYVEDLLPSVTCQVLLIRGDQDEAISSEQLGIMQAGLADAGLFTIPEAGHFAQMERPEIVAKAVRTLITP